MFPRYYMDSDVLHIAKKTKHMNISGACPFLEEIVGVEYNTYS